MKIDREETNIGAHAILVSKNGELIFQERDNFPGLINSGLIAMFGGTIRSGETVVEGLKRELKEELDLESRDEKITKLGIYKKTKDTDGVDWTVNVFVVRDVDINKIKILEGKALYTAVPEDALKNERLTRITKLALIDFVNNINQSRS